MKIAIITAGGAGMFCGSCMQDNTLARALRAVGADATLIPTYTSIRVDEEDVSTQRVFLGGINVYLDSMVPGWRYLPRVFRSVLDRPALVTWLARRFGGTDATQLGSLTVDMLEGGTGPHRAAMAELVEWLTAELQPDVILFSNALLSGVVSLLRPRYKGRIACLLQGDDIFLNALPEPWKSRAARLVTRNVSGMDLFLTHSRYYADYMQSLLNLPADHFRTIPLLMEHTHDELVHIANVKLTDNTQRETPANTTSAIRHRSEMKTVGYFARICPEKGAFRFLDAAEHFLRDRRNLRFVIGGFLPAQHEQLFHQRRLDLESRFGESFVWAGSPESRDEKFALLKSLDWLCVPSEYREPKGLYVLEAALVGVPSLVPSHGAFPERIEALGFGRLFDPMQPGALDKALQEIAAEPISEHQRDLAIQLRDNCHRAFGPESGARAILQQLTS